MNVTKIPLTNTGFFTIVDTEHAHLVQRYSWCESNGYAIRGHSTNGIRENIYMHRWLLVQIMGHIPHNLEIDHINGNKLDNRLENLRVVTRSQNAQNRKKRRDGKTTSRFACVTWNKCNKKWRARITVN